MSIVYISSAEFPIKSILYFLTLTADQGVLERELLLELLLLQGTHLSEKKSRLYWNRIYRPQEISCVKSYGLVKSA